MKTVNGDQKFKDDDPDWQLIAEYSLSEVPVDKDKGTEIMAGPLFQTMRALGLPPECLRRIDRTIMETVRSSRNNSNPGKLSLPVDILLFCHRKRMDRMQHPEDPLMGGVGYYGIERGNASYEGRHRIIEIYLYKEGE